MRGRPTVKSADINDLVKKLGHDPKKVTSVRMNAVRGGVSVTVTYTHRVEYEEGDDG